LQLIPHASDSDERTLHFLYIIGIHNRYDRLRNFSANDHEDIFKEPKRKTIPNNTSLD